MPKVLTLFEFPTVNGGENSWLTTVDYLRKDGWDIVVAAPDHGPWADLLHRRHLKHLPLTLSTGAGETRSQAERRRAIANVIHCCQPDLIHANSLNMARLAGPVAHGLSIPCVGHLRDIVRLSKQAVADLNQNSRLLCVSQATRQGHIAQGLLGNRAVVLHNGIDLDLFRPRPSTGYLHRELQLEPTARIVGGVGQLVMRKGWDLLIQVAQQIIAGPVDVAPANLHFVVAGECYSTKDEAIAYHRNLRQQATEGLLSGRVHLLGRRHDIDRLMPELTLLLHPARQEPLGRVLLEAAACGLPIVATDVGGTAEIFAEHPNAAKIVAAKPSTLAQAVREALDDDAWRSQARSQSRRCAETRFSQPRAARALAWHYADILFSRVIPSSWG